MYNKNAPETIQSMFNSIAKDYDRTNAVLSFQLHKWWNRELVRIAVLPYSPDAYLDLCCGTGDIAFTYLKKSPKPCQAYLLDFSDQMLSYAREKAGNLKLSSVHQLSYLNADAQVIPLDDQSVQCVTIAYGIRNVKDPIKCFKEVYRVLRPGGTFGILELTQPNNTFLRMGHKLFLRTCVPILGRYLTSNQAAYQYLCNSIQTFVKPPELISALRSIGFMHTKSLPLSGGTATILFAKKPM